MVKIGHYLSSSRGHMGTVYREGYVLKDALGSENDRFKRNGNS
jgi:hypothetical protein